jgi:hypothetical protein
MVDAIDLLRKLVAAVPPEEMLTFSGFKPVGTLDVLPQIVVTAGQLRAALGPSVEPPDPEQPVIIPVDMRVRVTAPAGLNVRAAPSIESAKVGSLRHKSVVKVDGKQGDWFHVAGNIKGWISAQWLEAT